MVFILTKENCKYWYNNFKYMMTFLQAQQSYFNEYYKHYGRVSLDSVFWALGVEISPEFPFLGWTTLNNPDGYIDFGISSIDNKSFVDSWHVKEHKRHYNDGTVVTVKAHIKSRVNTPKKIVLHINCPMNKEN